MHHCLCISELLHVIFECVATNAEEDQNHPGSSQVARKTLASLARTCRVFTSPALDVLWHDLYSFGPLLGLFPTVTSSVDDTRWLTFSNYAKRVKTIHGREARVPPQVKHEFVSSLQYCPEVFLPLLPNVTELEWRELSFSALEDSGISLLRYFAGPAVTTVTLSLVRWLAHSSSELAVLADLPRLCPNVTSFTVTLGFSWDYEPCKEVGRMVLEWPMLRTLRTCALPQHVMDHLLSRPHIDTLSIDYHAASPTYTGRIPSTVREVTLSADGPVLCTHFISSITASPTRFHLLIGMNDEQTEEDLAHMFHLLPHRISPAHLHTLAIQPRSGIIGIPLWHTLQLQPAFLAPLAAFAALRELDLDLLCTAQIGDADYARMARSLRCLRALKLGTANPSIMRPWPTASVRAVIAILTHCARLDTFHIVFDASIPPPGAVVREGRVGLGEEVVRKGWGVANRCIAAFGVGYSPIGDANVDAIAACLGSMMPRLVRIARKDRDREWRAVERLLGSG